MLDGDERRLRAGGREASRDIVQFVALREVAKLPPQAIAKELLEEIPAQVTQYLQKEGVTPEEVQRE